jgi:C_GCAxxG_C_C family probable redox protein
VSPRRESRSEIAARHFDAGFNCAESINLAFLPAGDDAARAAQMGATAFGGGIVRRGLTCGALTGAAMVIGRKLGRNTPADTEGKDRVYRVVESILADFEARYGTLECRALTNLDFNQPHEPDVSKRVHAEVCAPIVSYVAALVERALAEEETSRERS